MSVIDALEVVINGATSAGSLKGCAFSLLSGAGVVFAIWYFLPGTIATSELLWAAGFAVVALVLLFCHWLVKPVRRHLP